MSMERHRRYSVSEHGIVGRAELKLAEAAKAFHYDFRGKTVLDIGSSTGGFTELALKQGAARVIAVEKGTKQMKAPLRFDSRVELYEKTDFFDVDGFSSAVTSSDTATAPSSYGEYGSVRCSHLPRTSSKIISSSNKGEQLVVKQGENDGELVTRLQVDTVVADVSFVSLRKILAHAKEVVNERADYLVMLKPQFEADECQLNRGVVKNERMRREIIKQFETWVRQNGFLIVQKRDNEIVGKVGGNRERFYLLKLVKNRLA